MPVNSFQPSGLVNTTLAPASPSGVPADVVQGINDLSINDPGVNDWGIDDLGVNGSRPSTDGCRTPSPLASPGSGDRHLPPHAAPSQALGSLSQHPQASDVSDATGIDTPATLDSAAWASDSLSLSGFATSPASWPTLSSSPNSVSPLHFNLSPAALQDLLPTPSGFPTSATSLHASLISGLGPSPLSPPASVGLGPGVISTSPFPPAFGPGGALLNALPPTSPPSRAISPPGFGADAVAPQHALFEVIHLLRQQLSFLVQAWVADRERLQPARQDTEDEVQRIQAIMDSALEQWASERSAMEHQVEVLKAQVCRLQKENAAFKALAMAGTSKGNGVLFPGSQHAPAGDSSSPGINGPVAALLIPNTSRQSSGPKADALSLPPGLDGASRRPHFASPGSSRASPTGAPSPSQPAALDPRTQPRDSASNDFLAPLSTDQEPPASVIDVQQIDPKLEGIPIKAKAVQRCTFAPARGEASPPSSPHKNGVGRDSQARRRSPHSFSRDRARASRAKHTSSRDQTMQVLAAEESRRLTMHAGHTPNHSSSLIPTMTATGADTTGCQSGASTPSAAQSVSTEKDEDSSPRGHDDAEVEQEPETGSDMHSLNDADEDMQGHLEPLDDVPLKGPLMIKNIPAQDDIFFAKLDQKLESLSQGQNALPSVLRAALEESEQAAAGPSCAPAPPQQPSAGALRDWRPMPREAAGGGRNYMEPDVPIKFRTTSNFGAPFGSI